MMTEVTDKGRHRPSSTDLWCWSNF